MPTLPSERLDHRIEIAARIIRACRQQEVFADETAVAVIDALDAAPRVVTEVSDAMVTRALDAFDNSPEPWRDTWSPFDAMRAALTAALATPPARNEGDGVEVRAAVVWQKDGEWSVLGQTGVTDDLLKAQAASEGFTISAFITARVPKPQVPTIPAAVQEAER